MESDKPQEQTAADAQAPAQASSPAPSAAANTEYEQPASGGISPVVLILLAVIVIAVVCKFLNPTTTETKPNEQKGAFAPYIHGSSTTPGN